MSKIDDYIDHWIYTNNVSGSEEVAVRRALADVLEFREMDSFKQVPYGIVVALRESPHMQWTHNELGDFQVLGKFTKSNNVKVRCRCCKQLIKYGQEVIRFKFKNNSPFIIQGSIHTTETDCKEIGKVNGTE